MKFITRFVKIDERAPAVEYGLIAGAMGLALLAITPILAESLAVAFAR